MTTLDLIQELKIKGSFPSANDLFSNADYLVIFNHQLKSELVPLLMKLSEDYFLLTREYTISQGAKYRLPSRAIGSKLRDLQVREGGGNLVKIRRLFEEDRPHAHSGYYVTRNSVELSEDFTSGTLVMTFYARPNRLVLPAEAAQITAIDSANLQVTVGALPASFANGSACDLIQAKNPYDLLAFDNVVQGISGTTVTLTAIPEGLEVGDWLCLAEQSPVAMIPEELQPVLVQSALVAALSSKKDKAAEYEAAVLERLKADMVNMLDPRVDNDSVSIRSGRLLSFVSQGW